MDAIETPVPAAPSTTTIISTGGSGGGGGPAFGSFGPGDLIGVNSASTLVGVADIIAGNVLLSGGVNTLPSWGKLQLATHVIGTLPVGNGGTGLTSYAVGDLLYASGAAVLAKLADVATGNALISGGVTVAPSWGKIGLTTHVSGTLPIGNGGTASATALSGSSIMVSNGSAIVQGAAGTTTTVLHGNASGTPSYSAVSLTADVSGTLPVGNGGTGTATVFTTGSLVFAGTSGVYTQDNAHLFWDDTNNVLGVGTTAPFSSFGPSNFRGAEVSDPTSALFSLTSDGGAAYIFSVFNNTAGSAQGNMYWIRGRGTRASSVKVESEDYIGTILFLGIDVNGSAFGQAAGRIDCVVDGGTGTNDMPGRLMFSTTPDGTASPVERMRITNTGKVGIGTATVPSLLTVNGLINLKNYTVATLPAGTRGDIAYVTDALAPAFLAVLVGGGAVVTPCFYNGANWIGF